MSKTITKSENRELEIEKLDKENNSSQLFEVTEQNFNNNRRTIYLNKREIKALFNYSEGKDIQEYTGLTLE